MPTSLLTPTFDPLLFGLGPQGYGSDTGGAPGAFEDHPLYAVMNGFLLYGLGPSAGYLPGTGPDFFAALVAWFKASDTLAVAFPGGLISPSAPASIRLPYARAADVDPVRQATPDDYTCELVLSSYGLGPRAAKAAGRVLETALLSQTRARLEFSLEGDDWTEAGVRRLPESRVSAIGQDRNGNPICRFDQVYEFLAVKAS